MATSTSFGEWLQRRRKLLGLTQAALAEGVGCSVALIRKLESDERRPSAQIADLIAHALGVTADERSRFAQFARSGLVDTGAAFLADPADVSPSSPEILLTARERVFLRLMAFHQSPTEMAERLHLKLGTVRWYIKQIYSKLNVHSPEEAVAYAAAHGLIAPVGDFTVDLTPNDLPAPATSFIGRENDLDAIRQRLSGGTVRLLTLIGPPGVGKTRLALEAAAALSYRFPHGIYWAPLASVADASQVGSAIARALDIRVTDTQPVLEAIKQFLRRREILLLVDNFEHVLPAASMIAELLAASGSFKVLVTSREALHLYGEHRYTVSPLDLPQDDAPEHWLDAEAMRLFVERAQAVDGDFRVSAANVRTLRAICLRLEGIPLALELAAARTRLYAPEALLERLTSRLNELEDGARDLHPRHQVLRSAIAWSYDLLSADDKRLFAQLGVFAGGWTLDALQAVCDPPDRTAALLSLFDKGLVQSLQTRNGERRYFMLEMLREFALEQLNAMGDEPRLRRAHAAYFLAAAEQAEPGLWSADQTAIHQRLDADQHNLRAALQWTTVEQRLRMATALVWFWIRQGNYHEGLQWLEPALAASPEITPLRSRALMGLTLLTFFFYDFERLGASATALLEAAEAVGDDAGQALALAMLGIASAGQTDVETVLRRMEQGIEAAQRSRNDWFIAVTEDTLAILYMTAPSIRDLDRAGQLLADGLPHARRAAEPYALAWLLFGAGALERKRGNTETAKALLHEMLDHGGRMDDRRVTASALVELSFIAIHEGAVAPALALFQETAQLCAAVATKNGGAVELLIIGAELALLLDRAEDAGRLLSAASRFLDRYLFLPTDVLAFQQLVTTVQLRLEVAAFEAAWANGQQWTLAQATDYARSIDGPL